MSHPVPWGRTMPRWSIPVQPTLPVSIASTAGLAAVNANVSV